MKTMETQVAIIGAGPGGYSAAFRAADLGLDVTLVDPALNPGGVCLYCGCIPTKALLHAAKLVTQAREASRIGLTFADPKLDLAALRRWKERVVLDLTAGLSQLARARKIRYIQGTAGFIDSSCILVRPKTGEEERVEFEHAILATGSRPRVPSTFADIISADPVMDSSSGLELKDIPGRLLVVGGGYIGLELGTVYAALGSTVTITEVMPDLMPGLDRDLVAIFRKQADKIFRSIRLNSQVRLSLLDGGIQAEFDEAGTTSAETFDRVLIATGRQPNSDDAGLENTRVELDQHGFVKVDQQRRTNEESVFAVGDVTGGPLLAHKAMAEGRAAAEAIAGLNVAYDPKAIPAIEYTDPAIAWCGLGESEARKKGIDIRAGRFSWAASGRAATLDRREGLTKVIADPDTGRILGMGIVGENADELIAEGVLAMEMAATARDLELAVHPHPTLSETVMEAAASCLGLSTHTYRPKSSRVV